MSAVYHLGAVISIFLAILILIKRGKILSDYILGFWLICAGMNLFIYHRINDHEEFYKVIIIIYWMIMVLQSPLFYQYVHFLTRRNDRVKFKDLLHLIPSFLFMMYTLILIIAGKQDSIMELSGNSGAALSPVWILVLLYTVFSIPAYLVLAFYNLKLYDKRILEKYSSLEDVELVWLKRCIAGIALAWLLFIGLEGLSRLTTFIRPGESIRYGYYLFSIVLFYLGIYGIRNTNFFIENYISLSNDETPAENSKAPFAEESLKSRPQNLSDDILKNYVDKLNEVMVSSRPFLKTRLTLKDLSDETGIPAHIISYIINEQFKMNFYEFINGYRVEEFIKRYSESDHSRYTLLAVAMECGFSSKSSFYSIFKKHKGHSPLIYFSTKNHI